MSKTNGYHSNGKSGGLGGGTDSQIVDDLERGRHRRQTYSMLQRAIDSAMNLPEGTMKAAASTAIKDLSCDDGRIRARAREFLLKLQDSGVGAAIGLDKIERLDSGGATENIAVQYVIKEAMRPEALRE